MSRNVATIYPLDLSTSSTSDTVVFKKHRKMNYIVLIQELGASKYTPSQNDIGLSCSVSTWGETSGLGLWQSLVAREPAQSDHRTSL